MEKQRTFKKNGMVVLIISLIAEIIMILAIVALAEALSISIISEGVFGALLTLDIILMIVFITILCGLKVIKPNEALVLTLFGKFYGVLGEPGFYFVNPFCEAVYPKENKNNNMNLSELSAGNIQMPNKKVSLKAMTLNNEKQKVNDANGNPIEIGVVVIWKVIDPIKAVLDVEDYRKFVSIQSDSSIRAVARSYVYDGEDGENSLTGSTKEISNKLQELIQGAVVNGGIEIIDAKIAHLAYAPEIASAMLQRQQADAIIAARQKIVEGAVGMVEQALDDLSKRNVVELDDERKAQMVTNLLVVLCANKEAQPIVNSGSIF